MNYLTKVAMATKKFDEKIISAQQWIVELLGEEYDNVFSDEYVRRAEKIFSAFMNKFTENGDSSFEVEDKETQNLNDLLEQLREEKLKIQTCNLEYRANERAEARSKLFNETISDAVGRLKPIEFKRNYVKDYPVNVEGVLCISDAHNGIEINMNSLFGEKVNVYNPNILKARLQKLLEEVVNDKERYFDFDYLTVFDLGDAIQGILRQSDLMKLKMGVIDSALDYAETISNWLVALSEELEIGVEYICLGGNHDELRLLNGKKGDFDAENMGKVIREFVSLRLANNPNIKVAPYSECGFKTIQDINILAYHGDGSKNDSQEISFWENYHQVDIDILLEGHIHHKSENGVGYALNGGDKEVIHVPSLMGADTYGKKCRAISKAGAKFMLFEDGAKTWEKNYILN